MRVKAFLSMIYHRNNEFLKQQTFSTLNKNIKLYNC